MSKKWDPHKDEILRLYIVENMKLEQVMRHMLQTHGFDQKKPHYEYRLKLWGARKNVKKEVLEYISHQDRKRRPSQDLASDVFVVDGIVFSESRIKRARRRLNLDLSTTRWYGKAPSLKTPPGHEIRRTGPPASEIPIDWPGSLPWLQFEKRFKLVAPKSSKFIQILARAADNCRLISDINIGESFNLARAMYAAPHETQSLISNITRMLPCVPDGPKPSSVNTALPSPDDVATKILKAVLFQVSNKLYHKPNIYKKILRKHLLSLFQELDETNPMVLSRFIDSHDPTAGAVIESLYEAAVEYGATPLVSRLLEAGIDANALLPINWQYHYRISRGRASFQFGRNLTPMTALQSAASTRNIELADTLIKAGAKVDLGQPTPLQILCLSSDVGHPVALLFAHLLISNGAQVNIPSNNWPSPLEAAVMCENRSILHFLLQCGATDALRSIDEMRCSQLNYCLLPKYTRCIIRFPGVFDGFPSTSALQLAIIRAESSIAKVLISSLMGQEDIGKGLVEHRHLLEQALVTACVTDDQDCVQIILEKLGSQIEDKKDLVHAAFWATAQDMECRIAQLLLEHAGIRRKLQNSCRPIFQAAALHGNIALIMLLHSNGLDINRGAKLHIYLPEFDSDLLWSHPIPSTPLGCAIAMGHMEVMETLLDLGADTIEIDIITALASRSSKLVTQVLNQCGSVNLSNIEMSYDKPCYLDIAIRFGVGLTIIRKLIDAGATRQGHELVDAIRGNDQEVVDFFLPVCDILATDARGVSVLEVACCTGNLVMALQYLDRGGVYDSRALFCAVNRTVKMHDYRIVECIVAKRCPGPIDDWEASALALSIRMNDAILTNLLLHDDFQPSAALSIYCDDDTDSPLEDPERVVQEEVYPRNYDVFILFPVEKRGEEPCLNHYHWHCRRFSPLLVAVVMAQEQTVGTMVKHGYVPDPVLLSMLRRTSFSGNEIREMIMSTYVTRIPNVADQKWHGEMLLRALMDGVDLGIIQQHLLKLQSLDFEQGHWNPLLCAVRSGSCDHVRALLEAGATADSRKWNLAKEAFGEALKEGFLDMVSLLLKYGADINYDPHWAFDHALEHKSLSTVVFLLDHGLDINAPISKSSASRTCLEVAASTGSIDTVEILFSRGVNIQGRARVHFVKAVVAAVQQCHYATAKFLKERGGWNDEDDEFAKTPQVRESRHICPRFLYNDLTLEGCDHCETGEVNGTNNSTCSYEAADEQFTSNEMDPHTNDLSVLDIESDVMEYELVTQMHEWPSISYGRQDRELDTIVQGLLLEDGVIS
ncbi:hypothetical protein E8E14_010381 [Neopestalotiopsis sp. 37M]|nr:hypothetical protein E8E14_010381 [Neopestalotiopsis sp. 37M]